MITTIIFDLSEVYLRGMYGIEEKISHISGAEIPLDYIHLQQEAKDFFYGKISENEFWQRLITRHNWKIDIPTLKKLVRSQMTEIGGTREIMEKLHDKGYKLGLLSIHGKEWVEHVESKFDYHKLFHSKIYSFEVGVGKPDPKAFELILEKLGSKPEECLFVDDYEVNTKAARDLGIATILFENAKQLKNDLILMGIKF